MLFNLSDAWAQPGRILSGEVRSAVDGQPLQGVTITDEKGKGRALTDEEATTPYITATIQSKM